MMFRVEKSFHCTGLRILLKHLSVSAVLVSASHIAFAAGLLEIYQLAQDQDPAFEAARYTLESAQERLPQARAGFLPTLAATGGRNRSHGQYIFARDPATDRSVNAWNWTVQLSQPLVRMQNWENYNQAEAIVEQARAQYVLAEQDLIVRVAQAYFDFDIAREGIRVADAQLVAVEQQLNLAKRGFKAGTNAITDVHEAQARFDLARSQRVAAQNELESKRAEFEKIIGPLPANINALQQTVSPSVPEPNNPEAWGEMAQNYSPTVVAQRAAIVTAEREIAKDRAGHLPTVDLTASYGRSFSSGSNSTPSDYESRIRSNQIGLQVNIPIYSGGETSSRVRQAIADLYKARAELRGAQRLANATARQAFAGMVNGISQIEALNSAVESSRSSVKANQIGYKLGTRINIDVLNAEQQLFTAQRDLIKARYETLLQGLKLKAAAGNLKLEDIAALNGWF